MKTVATPAARATLFGAIVLWGFVSTLPDSQPDPKPASAPAAEFSADRAMVHVAAIAQQPHPLGSAEHTRVRDYIVDALRQAGLDPQIQRGTGEYNRGKFHNSGAVENIVARLAGSGNTRPVMLMAHYDSVSRGPGAGDDGHGVGVLLETLRALRAGPAVRNDVILLFTDGEERGLLGADLFMREHAWRNELGVVLNFDARGTSGPDYMFETSGHNAWLIDTLASVAPWAEGSSLGPEIYRMMPNDTDLTVFERGGVAGMNFAFIDSPENYHSPQDDVAHLDRRSVQQSGNYAVELARAFGNQDLSLRHSGDSIYFRTLITPLFAYPASYAGPLAWITAAGLALVTWLGRRAKGRWIAPVMGLMTAITVFISRAAPGASYLLEAPVLAGIVSFALLVTAPKQLAMGWRICALALLPSVACLLLIPLVQPLLIALGPADGAPVVAVIVLIGLICLTPQIVLVLRRSGGTIPT